MTQRTAVWSWTITMGFVGAKQVPFLSRPGRDGIRLDEDASQYITRLQHIAQAAKNWHTLKDSRNFPAAGSIALQELAEQVELLASYERQGGIE